MKRLLREQCLEKVFKRIC